MKKIIPVILVALSAFVAVWWLNRSDEANGADLTDENNRPGFISRDDPHESSRSGARRAQGPAEDKLQELSEEASADAKTGELLVKGVLGEDIPPELIVDIYPQAPAKSSGPDGTLFSSLDPGQYRVTLYGGEIIPIYHAEIEIEAGKRRSLKFDLERGFRFKGQVKSAYPEVPVPYATVDFNGETRVRCDGEGLFVVDARLSRTALSKITVSAEGWDTQIYHQLSIVDPENISIPLGRGSREVTMEIVNRTTDQIPDKWVARVTIAPLFTVRREVKVEGAKNRVTIDNLYASDHYRFELHFPGGEFPIQRQRVALEHGEEQTTIRFVIEEGAEIRAETFGPAALKQQATLQVRSVRNVVLAEAPIQKDGSFHLKHLGAGTFFLCLKSGGEVKSLEKLTLEGRESMKIKIDLLRRKVEHL